MTHVRGAGREGAGRRGRGVLVAAGLALAGAWLGTTAGAKEPAATPAPSGFAGAEACAKCHAKAHADWAPSNHALSTVEARGPEVPAEAAAGKPVAHPPGTSTWRARGDRAVVETLGPDGKPATYDLTYVVGRRRMRMYLARMDDGRVQVLPAMHDEGTGTWFDYTDLIFGVPDLPPDQPPAVKPGDPSFWTGPVRSFDARCSRCHVSGRELPAAPAAGTAPRARWRALGVDCEACHGPCAAHVEHWRALPSGPVAATTPDPILRLRDLDRARNVDACLVCHLEGELLESSVQPGDDVLARLDPTLLDDVERVDPYGRPLELVYEGLSFLSSRCAERGRLTCLSCHASHGSPHPMLLAAAVQDDAALCGRCHQDVLANPVRHTHHRVAGTGGRCVACHLPKVRVERGHGVVTDHTIGVPHLPDPAEGRVALDACTGCHTGARGYPAGAPKVEGPRLAQAFTSWWPEAKPTPPWAVTLRRGRAGEVDAVPALADLLGDPGQLRVVRASAARLLGRLGGPDSGPLLDAATDPDPLVRRQALAALGNVRSPEADAALLAALSDPSPGVRIRAARAAVEGWQRAQANPALLKAALPVLEEDANAVPDDDFRWFRLGSARQLAGDYAGALAAFERQVALDPFATAVREHLPRLKARIAQPPK